LSGRSSGDEVAGLWHSARLSFLTIKSGNTLGRLEDWKIGYRLIQPSSLPIFRQQLPVLKIKIDHRAKAGVTRRGSLALAFMPGRASQTN
jgi:hypothetical protein